MKRDSVWFDQLYEKLRPVLTGMARHYSAIWGVDPEDLVQVAGFALWTGGARYSILPFDQQLRIGNTIARRAMLHWCAAESHTPTYRGTSGGLPWFSGREERMTAPEEEP